MPQVPEIFWILKMLIFICIFPQSIEISEIVLSFASKICNGIIPTQTEICTALLIYLGFIINWERPIPKVVEYWVITSCITYGAHVIIVPAPLKRLFRLEKSIPKSLDSLYTQL